MDISIVIPCYHSANSIAELTERIINSVSGFAHTYEIILVHDAGHDNTWQVIKDLCTRYEHINGVNLMRNLGQHKATLSGLSYAKGDIIVTLDDDLQHPPEEIAKLYRHLKNHKDVDVVFGSYGEKQHSRFRNFGTFIQMQIRKKIFPDAAKIKITSFRAFKKNIVNELMLQKQTNPRIGLMTFSITTRVENVDVAHDKRKHGRSTYSLMKLIKTALSPIINYSSLPLQLISILGASVTLISLMVGLYYIIGYFAGAIFVPAIITFIIAILFCVGLTLFSFGIIGEYLSRIIEQQIMSTHYPVREDTFEKTPE